MTRKTQASVLLAVAVMIGGSIFLGGATMGSGISVTLIPSAYADANCAKADLEFNDQGNQRGNAKQCGFVSNTEGEPPRSCGGPNELKDNDGDGDAFCVNRGN